MIAFEIELKAMNKVFGIVFEAFRNNLQILGIAYQI